MTFNYELPFTTFTKTSYTEFPLRILERNYACYGSYEGSICIYLNFDLFNVEAV